ncbi:MAG: hypothetical protein PHU71_04540 [Candidatus Gracilibacteria bacterium]|nr:hypothetical protein [Candidatus Gracilibacteria bacterium]
MSKKMLIIIAGCLLLLIIFLILQSQQAEQDFEVAEVLEESCELDADCETPFDYLVRSNCPYESRCLDKKCTVVCPDF